MTIILYLCSTGKEYGAVATADGSQKATLHDHRRSVSSWLSGDNTNKKYMPSLGKKNVTPNLILFFNFLIL